eukprot:3246127-Amphidinium_carterae.2
MEPVINTGSHLVDHDCVQKICQGFKGWSGVTFVLLGEEAELFSYPSCRLRNAELTDDETGKMMRKMLVDDLLVVAISAGEGATGILLLAIQKLLVKINEHKYDVAQNPCVEVVLSELLDISLAIDVILVPSDDDSATSKLDKLRANKTGPKQTISDALSQQEYYRRRMQSAKTMALAVATLVPEMRSATEKSQSCSMSELPTLLARYPAWTDALSEGSCLHMERKEHIVLLGQSIILDVVSNILHAHACSCQLEETPLQCNGKLRSDMHVLVETLGREVSCLVDVVR